MARGWLAPVVEFYLPPDPSGEAVRHAATRAFRPLLELVERRPRAALTAAVDPGLARALLRHGQASILYDLAAAMERGQLELAGGALGHPLLPRLPRSEVERQIRLGHERMREAMGRGWRPRGLYPPALAWSRSVAEVAADRGLRWVLADELALGRLGQAPRDRVACLRGRPDILLFFRDRAVSAALAEGEKPGHKEGYRVAVVPAAAFEAGSAALQVLDALFSGAGPSLATLSTLASVFPDRTPVEPLPCSARTSIEELAAGVPFASWSAPDNEVQALLWHLARLGIAEMERLATSDAPAATRARRLLDENLHSAPFRFASARPWWKPEVVRAAARRFVEVLEAGRPAVEDQVCDDARLLCTRLDETLEDWESHGFADHLQGTAAAPGDEG